MRCGLGQLPAFPRKSSRSPNRVPAPRGHSLSWFAGLLALAGACSLPSSVPTTLACSQPILTRRFPFPPLSPHTRMLFGAAPHEASLFDPESLKTCNSHLPTAGCLSFLSLSSEVTLYFWQSLTIVPRAPCLSASLQVFFSVHAYSTDHLH